jgi:hypothetical protein
LSGDGERIWCFGGDNVKREDLRRNGSCEAKHVWLMKLASGFQNLSQGTIAASHNFLRKRIGKREFQKNPITMLAGGNVYDYLIRYRVRDFIHEAIG